MRQSTDGGPCSMPSNTSLTHPNLVPLGMYTDSSLLLKIGTEMSLVKRHSIVEMSILFRTTQGESTA
ncbi:F-box only protein 7, partial [Frankliniella fusca]